MRSPDPDADIESMMRQALAGSGASDLGDPRTSDLAVPDSTDGTIYESTFPYVVHNSARLQRAIFRWSPWTNGPNGPYVFCKDDEPYRGNEGIGVSYNGSPYEPQGIALNPPVFLFRVDSNPSHPLYAFCYMVQFYDNTGGYNVLPQSDNAVDITAVRNDYRYTFDSFEGLRIPKVHVSVLPDQMVPGDFASPYVTETSIPGDDGDEFALIVRIRESEAGGFVNFDLPVYAVDRNNNRVDATGYFKGRLEGVTSDCGDCVMVDGKAYMNVTLPVTSANYYDLTKFELYSTQDCDFDRDWGQTTFGYLRGCTKVTATNEVPGDVAEIDPFPYPLTEDAKDDFNLVAVGATKEQRKSFLENFRDTTVNAVKIGVTLIPIVGDGIDLSLQAIASLRGQEVDYFLVLIATGGLALDLGTGGVADVTTPIKVVYKLSKQAAEEGLGGVFAEVLEQTLKNLVDSGTSVKVTLETLGDQFGTLLRLAVDGGPAAIKSADRLANGLRNLPSCPLSATGLSVQAGCNPQDIVDTVQDLVNRAIADNVKAKELTDNLVAVCCDVASGGKGVIPNSEKLLNKATSANVPTNVKGVIGEAFAGDAIRSGGFSDVKYVLEEVPMPPNSETAFREIDLTAEGPNGQLYIVDGKYGRKASIDGQIRDLKRYAANQTPPARLLLVSTQGFLDKEIAKILSNDVDVYDPVKGLLTNNP